jgi:hypothetical protein
LTADLELRRELRLRQAGGQRRSSSRFETNSAAMIVVLPTALTIVRFEGQTGKLMLDLSLTAFETLKRHELLGISAAHIVAQGPHSVRRPFLF